MKLAVITSPFNSVVLLISAKLASPSAQKLHSKQWAVNKTVRPALHTFSLVNHSSVIQPEINLYLPNAFLCGVVVKK